MPSSTPSHFSAASSGVIPCFAHLRLISRRRRIDARSCSSKPRAPANRCHVSRETFLPASIRARLAMSLSHRPMLSQAQRSVRRFLTILASSRRISPYVAAIVCTPPVQRRRDTLDVVDAQILCYRLDCFACAVADKRIPSHIRQVLQPCELLWACMIRLVGTL